MNTIYSDPKEIHSGSKTIYSDPKGSGRTPLSGMQTMMHREKSPGYVEYLTFLFILSTVFFLGTLIPFQRTVWAQILCGALPALILLLLFLYMTRQRRVGRFWAFCAAVIAVCLSALSLYCMAQFLYFCVLQELPVWLFPAAFLVCAFYGALWDVHLLQRFCKLCGPPVIFLLVLSLLSGASKIRFSLQYGIFLWRDYLRVQTSSFLYGTLLFGVLFLLEGILLLTLLRTETAFEKQTVSPEAGSGGKKKHHTLCRGFVKGYLLAVVSLAAIYFVTVLALGPAVFEFLTYPVYYPPGLSGSAEYLERTEIILLAVLLFPEFVKMTLCILMIKKSLLRFFRPEDIGR